MKEQIGIKVYVFGQLYEPATIEMVEVDSIDDTVKQLRKEYGILAKIEITCWNADWNK